MIQKCALLLVFSLYCIQGQFTYLLQGADWGENCTGHAQSPIDLKATKFIRQQNALKIEFSQLWDYFIDQKLYTIVPSDKDVRSITLNALPGGPQMFYFNSMHFHAPAEHFIQGIQYDLELHIVHVNPQYKYQYAVLCIFFKVDPKIHMNLFLFSLINSFYVNLDYLFKSSTTQGINAYQEQVELIDTSKFYLYQGSLTTPPCTEAVNFIAFDQVVPISANQLEFFIRMWQKNKKFAKGNGSNRKIQELKGREVYYIYEKDDTFMHTVI